MQGTNAQYVGNGYNNNNDDENSQAEGVEGAVGYSNQSSSANTSNNNNNNNIGSNNASNTNSNAHYENLYESVEPYHAAAIVNPAQPPANPQRNNQPASAPASANAQAYHPLAYRNELYDRTSGYDIPRKTRHNNNPDVNRVRYANYPRTRRQRSFDDTESFQYGSYADYARYENMYEKVREEPEYQNAAARYGRLDVIGHGIGRIERHLSSSCGNIDHYSLGGHYAVLGHSHLGTVGHIRLNPAAAQQNSKDSSSVKSFFSCLGGENSQSMTNIDRAGNDSSSSSNSSTANHNSGAIPKQNKKQQAQKNAQQSTYETPPHHNPGTLNRISKSSLQWLLMNKWLPLWAGEGPDYKIIDFNFMFSRKCEGCDEMQSGPNQGLVRFNGQAEMRPHNYEGADVIPPPREYPTMNGHYPRVIRPVPQQLSRLNESGEYPRNGDDLYDRPRCRDFQTRRDLFNQQQSENHYHDPFRNWAFNFDDNTFRPAGNRQEPKPKDIRRITDGTFPKEQSPPENPSSRFGHSYYDPVPSTSRTESDSLGSSHSGSVSSVVQVTFENNDTKQTLDVSPRLNIEQSDNTESYASNRSSDSTNEDEDDASIIISDNDQ